MCLLPLLDQVIILRIHLDVVEHSQCNCMKGKFSMLLSVFIKPLLKISTLGIDEYLGAFQMF